MADFQINGVTHDYSSIELQIGPIGYEPRITEINYKTALKGKKVFGTPRKAIGRTGGVEEPESSITFIKEGWDDLVEKLGDGFGLVEWNAVITYRKRGSSLFTTDELIQCRIEEPDFSPSQGDEALTVKVGISVMRIKWNGKEIADNQIG